MVNTVAMTTRRALGEHRLLPRPNTLSCNVIEGEIIGKSESVGSAPTLIDSSLATLPSSHENQARQTKY